MPNPVLERPKQQQNAYNTPAKRLAFIIGCDHYESDAIPNLNFAVNDAKSFYDILVDPEIGSYRADEEAFLIKNPASTAISKQILNCVRNLRPDDAILIYYSGHGLKNESGDLYFATTDSDPEGALDIGTLSGKLLRDYLNKSRSKQICIILDCCYAGAFGEKGLMTSAEIDDDIKNNLSAEGNVILMSASPTQRSKEDEVVGHGIFTHYLVEGLKTGSADKDDNGLITPIELHTYIKERMAQDGKTEQKPKINVTGAGGDFPLVISKHKRAKWKKDIDEHVTACLAQKNHLAAIEYLNSMLQESRGEVEENDIKAKIQQVSEDQKRLVNNFKKSILEAQANAELEDSLVAEVIACINERPDFLFQHESRNQCEELVQDCFRGNVELAYLARKWTNYKASQGSKHASQPESKPEIEITPEPVTESVVEQSPSTTETDTNTDINLDVKIPVEPRSAWYDYWKTHRWLRLSALSVLITAAISILILELSVAPYNKNAMRVGIAIKDGNTADDTKSAFKMLLDEMNNILNQNNSEFLFDTRNIVAEHRLADLAAKIDKGEIELAGEFSPFLVYKFFEKHKMKAIVSPKYYDNENYSSVIFARQDAPFLNNHNNDKLGSLIDALKQSKGQKRIIVTGDEHTSTSNSTSGYWYPRKAILEMLNVDGKFSFLDVAKLDTESNIIHKVCRGGDIIAGALAKFRIFDSKTNQLKTCSETNVPLVKIEEIKRIPQGAYVLRKELYADLVDEKALSDIGDAWSQAVENLYEQDRSDNSTSQKYLNNKYIGEYWKKLRKDYYYYDEALKVFNKPDKKLQQIEFKQRFSLVIAFIILVVGTAVYFYIKQPRRQTI